MNAKVSPGVDVSRGVRVPLPEPGSRSQAAAESRLYPDDVCVPKDAGRWPGRLFLRKLQGEVRMGGRAFFLCFLLLDHGPRCGLGCRHGRGVRGVSFTSGRSAQQRAVKAEDRQPGNCRTTPLQLCGVGNLIFERGR